MPDLPAARGHLHVADADTGFGYSLANQLTLNIEVARKAKKK